MTQDIGLVICIYVLIRYLSFTMRSTENGAVRIFSVFAAILTILIALNMLSPRN